MDGSLPRNVTGAREVIFCGPIDIRALVVLLRPESMHSNICETSIRKPFMQHGSLIMGTRREIQRRRGQLSGHRYRTPSPLKPVRSHARLPWIRALTTPNCGF